MVPEVIFEEIIKVLGRGYEILRIFQSVVYAGVISPFANLDII